MKWIWKRRMHYSWNCKVYPPIKIDMATMFFYIYLDTIVRKIWLHFKMVSAWCWPFPKASMLYIGEGLWIGSGSAQHLPMSLAHRCQKKWPIFCIRHFQMQFCQQKKCTLIKISLNFVPKGPVGNEPALVQIMALVQIRWYTIVWNNMA